MKSVEASELAARSQALLDEVAETKQPIVITQHGHPVACLVPHREKPDSLFGRHRAEIEITGDIVSPLEDEWGADR